MGEKEILRISGEMMGHGSERHVYPHEDTDKVVKIVHTDKHEAFESGNENFIKGEFYLTKIFNYLLPDRIPDIHLTSAKYQATVQERKNTNEDHNIVRDASVKKYQAKQAGQVEPPYTTDERSASANLRALVNESGVFSEFTDLGLYSDAVDYSSHNFDESPEGAMYIDSIVPWNTYRKGSPARPFRLNFDPEKVRAAIMSRAENLEQAQALHWLDHLLELAAQEKIKREDLIAQGEKLG